jgi:AraC-like DNA-binding protein
LDETSVKDNSQGGIMSACVSTQPFSSSLVDVESALSVPPKEVGSLEQAFHDTSREGRGAGLQVSGSDRDTYLVSSHDPGRHVEMEYVRLGPGVWLVFGEFQFDAPVVQWHRQHSELTFVVVLRGASMITSASAPQQRSFCAEGHVIGTASVGETLICRHIPPGVRCQAVSLIFDGEESLMRFGLDPVEVRRWLHPQDSAIDSGRATFRAAVGTPNSLVLKAAQAILWARFGGSRRRLYLRSKAGELMCHLLCTPANAHGGIDVSNIGPNSDDSLAAIAHAALSEPEDCPEIGALAIRLNVSAGRLVAAFKSKYGVSPRDHMTSTRMVRAKRLIEQTDTPLIDVALACGYEHHSSFSTAYRRTFGQTPIETRRSAANVA